MVGNEKKYGKYDSNLQMFCQEPPKFKTRGSMDPIDAPPIEQGEATDDQWNRFLSWVGYLRLLATHGLAGPRSRDDSAPTIKDVTERPQPVPRPGPGWQLGPAHPDYTPTNPPTFMPHPTAPKDYTDTD